MCITRKSTANFILTTGGVECAAKSHVGLVATHSYVATNTEYASIFQESVRLCSVQSFVC